MQSAPNNKGLFGGSQKQRVFTVVAGAGGLLVVFAIVFSLIFGGGANYTEKLVGLAARQAEIIRVAEIGETQAASLDTKNYASTVKLSMTSAHNQLLGTLSDQGRKVNPKELVTAKDAGTDELLTTAGQTNRFDEVFTAEIAAAVKAYQQELRQVYESSNSSKEKQTLQNLFNQTIQLNASIDQT